MAEQMEVDSLSDIGDSSVIVTADDASPHVLDLFRSPIDWDCTHPRPPLTDEEQTEAGLSGITYYIAGKTIQCIAQLETARKHGQKVTSGAARKACNDEHIDRE